MPGHRPERVAEMVHREIAERLRTEIKDPRVVPISITSVEVTKDLSRAVVNYLPLGAYGAEGQRDRELEDGLEDAARKLRGRIGRALRLRHAPEIVFVWDLNTQEAFRVMNVLDRLAAQRRETEIPDGSDDASADQAGEGEE